MSFSEALADTNAELMQFKGDVRLGLTRLERRLARCLVAVAALLVGFGPLVSSAAWGCNPSTANPARYLSIVLQDIG